MAFRMISRHWLWYWRARRAEPSRRLIMELTVSTCHRCPYVGLYRANRCFMTRRQRPAGGLSVGRPWVGGMIVLVPKDRGTSRGQTYCLVNLTISLTPKDSIPFWY